MHLAAYRLTNFRRLQDACVEVEKDVTIFVGANNSGKTSATHAVQMFLGGDKGSFSINDFSVATWDTFVSAGSANEGDAPPLPRLALDLWFSVTEDDLHRVMDLLPSLAWRGKCVGIRIEFGPADQTSLLQKYREEKAEAARLRGAAETGTYHPWPRTLREYLDKHLAREYQFRYYALNETEFAPEFSALDVCNPIPLDDDGEQSGRKILASLIRVDVLNAQRFLSDGEGSARSDNLSHRLAGFYKHLKQHEQDYNAMQALAQSQELLDDHFKKVFAPTLKSLSELGYPGLDQPSLVVRSELSPERILSDRSGTAVHYSLPDADDATLPDKYNGLGFKNLIYMVVELLEMHARWCAPQPVRPALHLVFIEEPEAHLHTQIQQVFIRQISGIQDLQCAAPFARQFIISTHSPHIPYERGFEPVRYFRREGPVSVVRNLSRFKENATEAQDFLERYIKLTHCDLFFADAAILVEGNVERLLLPLMIDRVDDAGSLRSRYLSTIEIGGAFAHKFQSLLRFLGIPTLVITDLDSCEAGSNGSKCFPEAPAAVTSNEALKKWLPKKSTVKELLAASASDRTDPGDSAGRNRVYVVYQTEEDTTWNDKPLRVAGRTFEEAFAITNLQWTQHVDQKDLGLRVKDGTELSVSDLVDKVRERVGSGNLNKTTFAVSLLGCTDQTWVVPAYIADGLVWLATELGRPNTPQAELGDESAGL